MQTTYRTVISPEYRTAYEYFDEMGRLFGKLERRLFVDWHVLGRSRSELKREYIKKYGITARQFNSLWNSVAGKVSSVAESLKYRKATLEGRIESIEKFIKEKERAVKNARNRLKQKKLKQGRAEWEEIIKKPARLKFVLHQKKRRLRNLRHKLAAVERDIKEDKYRICFGGRKLFQARHNLEANGYANHEEWVRDWREARSSGFFIIGSRDESYGNQSCTYSIDGSLRMRVVDRMSDRYGVYITIPGVVFPYGREQLDSARNFVVIRGKNGLSRKVYDRAIPYRFCETGRPLVRSRESGAC